ncbi:MAG: hypothetical protein O2930_00255 [Acidobacteria bacterium]|nr:hypothetical protein [Acidobacteriota bacterium]
MTSTRNAYCAALGISVPRLEYAKSSPDANYYSLLIIALLERGEPMGLDEIAARFAAAGVAPTAREALASLKRCKPARAPIYRDGNQYALDPHDDEVSFWLFRLGLRPARVPPLQAIGPAPGPLPSPGDPITVASLNEAWRDGVPNTWSAQRVAVAVLDAHDGAMAGADVMAFVSARSGWSPLRAESVQFWRSGAITVREDGLWLLDRSHDVVRSTREAVRARVSDMRRWAAMRPDPAAMEAHRRRIEREREAHARQLAAMRRVLVHAFPASRPLALALVDVAERKVNTFIREEVARAVERLTDYEIIGAVGVRTLLRTLKVDAGERRLAELGPPQKTRQLNRQGRTLTITTELLVQGSCGISRPFGDERTMHEYLRGGADTRLRRRLEADAKSLFALYQYGRLHGCVRLRWGFIDEMLPAPWVHRDENTLYHLLKDAHERDVPLEVVVGSAPGWADPWARAQGAYVATDAWHSPSLLADEQGYEIPRTDVQLARLLENAQESE